MAAASRSLATALPRARFAARLVLAPDRFRLVASDLSRRDAAGLAIAPHRVDHRTHSDVELLGDLPPRQSTLINRHDRPLAKIKVSVR
jgi:hypothetical protein